MTKAASGRDDYGPGVLAEVGRLDRDIERLRSEGVVWPEPVELV